jgi:hypothetical protein
MAVATISLVELTFPDCSQKTIGMFGQVVMSNGTYVTGGIPMGLILFADARTVDYNGFLYCNVWDEEAVSSLLTYKYSPVNDVLQIFQGNTEYPNGVSVNIVDPPINVDAPLVISPNPHQQNLLIFEARFDRTCVRG